MFVSCRWDELKASRAWSASEAPGVKATSRSKFGKPKAEAAFPKARHKEKPLRKKSFYIK